MSKKPVTRLQSKKNLELKDDEEIENPFKPKRNLPQDPDFNRSRSIPSGLDFLSSTTISDNNSLNPYISTRTISSSDITLPFSSDSTFKNTNPSVIEKRITTINMAIPANQTVSLKDAIKIIPEFDGSNISLGQFLDGCMEAKEMVEPAAERNLLRLIKTKIFGEARQSIADQSFNTVAELRDYLRTIYVSTKSIQQLIGELGREYQREGESVLSFANRIRGIGRKILENKKLTAEGLTSSFRKSTEDNIAECFRQGLLPSIEQRLGNSEDISEILKEAIQIEKRMEAQETLRQPRLRVENLRKKFINACQLCKKEGHGASECRTRNKYCDHCKKPGHTVDQCFARNTKFAVKAVTCQLCNKPGHVATSCYISTRCQVCNRNGHTAKECRFLDQRAKPTFTSEPECQLCHQKGHTATQCHTQRTATKVVNNKPTCAYCKTEGHTIKECRKRQYNNQNAKQGNGSKPLEKSANAEVHPVQTRSINTTQFDEMLCKLLPLD